MRYRTELTDKIITSEWGKRILNIVSPTYGDDYVSLWLFQVIGAQLDKVYKWSDEYKAQLVPQTATWGLYLWESEYGLVPDPDWTIEQRRQNVINKMWSNGPMNPAKLAKIITNVAGAETTIKERTGKRKFTIYISSRPYLVDETAVRKKVDTLKPAHLIYDVIYQNAVTTSIYIGGHIQTFKEITLKEV